MIWTKNGPSRKYTAEQGNSSIVVDIIQEVLGELSLSDLSK